MSADAANMQPRTFVEAARHQGPVQGYTHTLYKYPARFSPIFARSAIETFTAPGDVILDPFVGGGSTVVEALLSGRNALASDISSLAVFLTRTKAVPLSEADIQVVSDWLDSALGKLNIHAPAKNLRLGDFEGYDRNMPWRLRKLCEQYLASVTDLPARRQQRFARCVLLRCGQWAMDCRKTIPGVAEFRQALAVTFDEHVEAMRQYRVALTEAIKDHGKKPTFRCVQSSAGELRPDSFSQPDVKAKLVLTSPPYPGVHVLYHRWSVRGRRESPAPFWIADCRDGHGNAHYTFGGRKHDKLKSYFAGIEHAFASVRDLLADDGLVVQLVAFSDQGWQLDAYLESMSRAGFIEVFPNDVGIPWEGRLWRSVPGRRWYSRIRGNIPSSNEVVLFHRKNAISSCCLAA